MKKRLSTPISPSYLLEYLQNKLDLIEARDEGTNVRVSFIDERNLRVYFIESNESYQLQCTANSITIEKSRGFISKLFGSSSKQDDPKISAIANAIDELKLDEETKIKELDIKLNKAKINLLENKIDHAFNHAIEGYKIAQYLDEKSPMDYRDKLGLYQFVIAEILRRKKQLKKSEEFADKSISSFTWLISNYIVTENINSIVSAYHMKAVYLAGLDDQLSKEHNNEQYTQWSSFFAGEDIDRSELVNITDSIIKRETINLNIGSKKFNIDHEMNLQNDNNDFFETNPSDDKNRIEEFSQDQVIILNSLKESFQTDADIDLDSSIQKNDGSIGELEACQFLMDLETKIGWKPREEEEDLLLFKILYSKTIREILDFTIQAHNEENSISELFELYNGKQRLITIKHHPILREVILGRSANKLALLIGNDFEESVFPDGTEWHFNNHGFSIYFKEEDPVRKINRFKVYEEFEGKIPELKVSFNNTLKDVEHIYGHPEVTYSGDYIHYEYYDEKITFSSIDDTDSDSSPQIEQIRFSF